MHETIREFASEQLAASDEEELIRRAHAEWLMRLVSPRGAPGHHEVRSPEELDLAQRELDNIRAALAWTLDNDPTLGLELTVGLEEFWVIRGPSEGAAWHERLLERAADAPPALRAAGLRSLAGALDIVGDHDGAAPHYRASFELLEALGDDVEMSNLRFRIGANAVNRGDEKAGWPFIETALREFRRAGLPFREAQALSYLAWKAKLEGDLELAVRLYSESAGIVHSLGWPWWEALALSSLAELERQRGNLEAAARHARDALTIGLDISDRSASIFAAAELASTAAAAGAADVAGRLWGAIESDEASGSIGQWPKYRPQYVELLLPASGPEFERARDEGHLLSLAEAAALGGAPIADSS
jgi:tetratricopeptide (TPR) repeat protein